MKFISGLRNNKTFVSSFSLLTFLISTLGIGLLIGRIFIDELAFDRFLVTIFYFTTQSNLLVFAVLFLFLLKKNHKKWFKIISLIALIDITITGLVFHIFLTTFVANINFMQHLLHTIIPLLYIAFYIVILDTNFKLNQFWIGLIHPFIFLVSVFTWIHPFFGDRIEQIMLDFQGASYVYPFLDPATYNNGFAGLLLFNLGLLMPLIILITIVMIFLKSKIEGKINH
ncbi:MAG: hypothetical protein K9L02_00570 [Acholeplasmataceae bacterium]|nr:hypothetical protein [Acholeplasmataceae bacterium]